MTKTMELMNSLVPISQFNRGQASRIFDRLHQVSQLVVLKNNQPAAIILSPEEYARLSEIEENYLLFQEASARLCENTDAPVPIEDVMAELGISEDDLKSGEDVVIE